MTAFLLLISLAQAQQLSAQRFAPSVDGRLFATITDPDVGARGVGGGVFFNYADDPFIYRYNDDAQTEIEILGSVATTNVVAYANLAPIRIGVDLPLHVASTGYGVEGFRLIGDMALDAKYSLINRGEGPVGLGFTARLGLPTGNGETWLGERNATAEARVNASVGDRVVTAATLGLRAPLGRATDLPDVTWGSRLVYGAGVSVPVTGPVWVSAEATGEILFQSGSSPGAFPLEGLLMVRGNPTGDLLASLGGGMGLTQGIGAPDWRVVAGVSWTPGQERVATDAVLARTTSDRDGDGFADERDLCPDQPEDRNGKGDDDGCPDAGLTPTRIIVADERGAWIAGARVELKSGPEAGTYTTPDGEIVRSLPAGDYRVKVTADGYGALSDALDVPDAPRHEAVFRLTQEQAEGTLTLSVLDESGKPVAATARLLGLDTPIDVPQDGVGQGRIPAGTYEVVVSAPGYTTARRTIKVEPEGSASLDVLLTSGKVVVTQDRIVIHERVFFEFDSAVIKAESFALLDEVASALAAHPEIALVEVQGHTDDQGGADYNRRLSQQRAEAVSRYLVQRGVSSSRLSSRGYGEDAPLQPGTAPEVRATNRRVEFVIKKRTGTN